MTDKSTELSQIIEKEVEKIGRFRSAVGANPDIDTLTGLGQSLTQLNHALREKMQEDTRQDMVSIIKTLENGGDPSPVEMGLIRDWIVGDAATYTKMENNFADWVGELNRLMIELSGLSAEASSPAKMLQHQALVRDALRTAGDIQYFVEERERAARFEAATKAGWTDNGRTVVAEILRGKLMYDDV